LTYYRFSHSEMRDDRESDDNTGVAWLSSARAVGCSLQWGNERNPCPELNILRGLPKFIFGGSGDDVKSAWPL
jgi:hypothetical protein